MNKAEELVELISDLAKDQADWCVSRHASSWDSWPSESEIRASEKALLTFIEEEVVFKSDLVSLDRSTYIPPEVEYYSAKDSSNCMHVWVDQGTETTCAHCGNEYIP